MPIGGRTTLTGGTGLVYGSDGASAFMNPSTLVRIDPGRLTVSVNFYSFGLEVAPDWYAPGEIDRTRYGQLDPPGATLTDVAFDILPSSLCLVFNAPSIRLVRAAEGSEERQRASRLAVCFATTQRYELSFAAENFEHRSAAGVTRQGQTVGQRYTRFAIGPTYAFKIDDHFSVGASAHASLAIHRSLYAGSATTFGTAPSPVSSFFYGASRGDSLQLSGILGATYRAASGSFGLALESPSLHVYGRGGANQSTHFEGAGAASSSSITADGDFISRAPFRVGAGAGIERRWGTAEINVSYWTAMEKAYRAGVRGNRTDIDNTVVSDVPVQLDLFGRAGPVVNASLGTEFFVTPRLSLLGGIGTDFSAVPSSGPKATLFNFYAERSHRVAGSFGIGSYGPEGELLFGGEVSYGTGEVLAVNPYVVPSRLDPTDQGTFRLVLIVAGSTSFRAIKRAVEDVGDVLGPSNKKPDPP